MKKTWVLLLLTAFFVITGCQKPAERPVDAADDFQWEVDRFADLRILRYQVPGFNDLTPKQKELIYYLSEASLWGRDIVTDQNYKHNLTIRKTLDAVVEGYQGNRNTPEWREFMVYTKRVWFSNGIHHHYSTDKFIPGFSPEYFKSLIENSEGADFPVKDGQSLNEFIAFLEPVLFDPKVDAKKVSQDSTGDLVADSAVNFYEGVTQAEVEDYYKSLTDEDNPTPPSYGLNSRVVKKDGELTEEVYFIDGLYGPAIEKIVFWLEKAAGAAENDQQRKVIEKLIQYYRTGNLKTFDEYNILWVNDTESHIDFINGFIEV
ncbi:MAG: dihydrofolate reductase, partial [Candidatus Aminicenantes bacterium]